ncbi:hypothetical protein MHO82_23085 [Vibrio sp. Of7-15]|uniref:hypothetical protein n=1 Tax=Vibrio sp. Of7-15 TaxID=2724879 RepID=UPI001EF25A5B|nr:hypothetical protein [Vibrio sp. Of7-15]MCG7499755.1 hypothetical protein [Vibrio sp. Of7-15]
MESIEDLKKSLGCVKELAKLVNFQDDILTNDDFEMCINAFEEVFDTLQGNNMFSPEAVGDMFVDLRNIAGPESDSAKSANALAGYFYSFGQVNDDLNGYRKLNNNSFSINMGRFINSALSIESINIKFGKDLVNFSKQLP